MAKTILQNVFKIKDFKNLQQETTKSERQSFHRLCCGGQERYRFVALLTQYLLLNKISLRRAYTMKFFFHRWKFNHLFPFDSFLSAFNTCILLRNVNEIFQSTIIKVFQKKKFYQIFDKTFFL